jgi:hypothetical protein
VAETSHGLSPQPIPETTEEGHLGKFCSSGGNEDIGLDASKYLEKRWNLRWVMLGIGIKSDDHLIVFLEGILESLPESCSLSEVRGVFQEMGSVFQSHPSRLIRRPVIHNNGIDMKRPNFLQNGSKGQSSVVRRDEDTDFVQI